MHFVHDFPHTFIDCAESSELFSSPEDPESSSLTEEEIATVEKTVEGFVFCLMPLEGLNFASVPLLMPCTCFALELTKLIA
jgi:hypothetical protein